MRNLIIILLLVSCKPKPEFVINGKGYYTKCHCLKSETKTVYEYHYGHSPLDGGFKGHYGPNSKTVCIEWDIDTIEIK